LAFGLSIGLLIQTMVARVASSSLFTTFVSLVIITNAVTIGVDMSLALEGEHSNVFSSMEHFYLTIYTIELLMCFFVHGYFCLQDNWVKFDFVLVAVGVVDTWILPAAAADGDQLGLLLMLRIMRLGRLARTGRLLVRFMGLWMLVSGILNSAGTMLYTLLLLIIILYIFAAIVVEFITNNPLAKGPAADPEFAAIVHDYFDNSPQTMLTLVQFVCLDRLAVSFVPSVSKISGSSSISFWSSWLYLLCS
jgi:hypothetical protein